MVVRDADGFMVRFRADEGTYEFPSSQVETDSVVSTCVPADEGGEEGPDEASSEGGGLIETGLFLLFWLWKRFAHCVFKPQIYNLK